MKKLLLFAFAIVFTLNTNAQLAFDQKAPLIDHLKDVNKEWRHYQGPIASSTELVSFANENERIAKHLELVESHLRSNPSVELSAEQLEKRTENLNTLNEYWKEGRFPVNLYHNVRQPYFIDHLNTACAVGYLLRESGHSDMAELVHENMNYAYVREIPYTELLDWAGENGFTQDELAWVQPGYPPSTIWSGFGTGTDSSVTALHWDDNSSYLYVAGNFSNADGVACTRVAKWNGSTFEALGAGLDGVATDLIVFDGNLYASGSFNAGYMDLATWDGNQWTYSVVHPGKYSVSYDLYIFNNELFIAGGAAGFAGVSYFVSGMGGGTWAVVGGEFDEAVYALGEHNGSLAAAGAFTLNYDLGGTPMNYVASYFGTAWWELGGGLDNEVYALLHRNNALYAGGKMQIDSTNQTFGLAHIDDYGTMWENDIQSVDYGTFNGEKHISSLVEINGTLFAGGAFQMDLLFGEFGDNIGQLDETYNYLLPKAVMDGKVETVGTDGTALIMGGEFLNANFTPVNYLAKTDINIGISELEEIGVSIITDNAQGLIYIDMNEAVTPGSIFCSIVDINGKQMMEGVQLISGRTALDASGWSKGVYLVDIIAGGQRATTTKVVLE